MNSTKNEKISEQFPEKQDEKSPREESLLVNQEMYEAMVQPRNYVGKGTKILGVEHHQ
jgi:hypothetical protein